VHNLTLLTPTYLAMVLRSPKVPGISRFAKFHGTQSLKQQCRPRNLPSSIAPTNYCATSPSTAGLVALLLGTLSAPISGSVGRVVGVAYRILIVHVPAGATVAPVQVLAVMLYKPPMLSERAGVPIVSGVAPVFVIVTTLVTGARGVGIVKVRVRKPKIVASVPFVAEVKARVPDAVTVKVTVLLVPPGVVTLTVLAEMVAVPEIVKFAVTVVELTTVKPLTVMPVPDTLIAVAPVRLVPVRVTGTTVSRTPEVGEIEVNVGAAGPATRTSTAPTSTVFGCPGVPGSGLGLPKKSVLGNVNPGAPNGCTLQPWPIALALVHGM